MKQALPQVHLPLEKGLKTPTSTRRVRSRQDKENVHENKQHLVVDVPYSEPLRTPRVQHRADAVATLPTMLSPGERPPAVLNQQKQPQKQQQATKATQHTMGSRARAILNALPSKQHHSTPSQLRTPFSEKQITTPPTDSTQSNTSSTSQHNVTRSSPSFSANRFSPDTATTRSFPTARSSSIEPVAVPRPTVLDQSVNEFQFRTLKPTLSSERIVRSNDSGNTLKRPPTPSSPYLTSSSERSSQYSSSAEELGCYNIDPDELIEPREDSDPLVEHFRQRYLFSPAPPLHFVAQAPAPMPEEPHLRLVSPRPAIAGFDIDKSCECNYLF